MARNVRNLVIGGAVLLLLIAAIVVLMVTEPGDTEDDTADGNEYIVHTFVDKAQSEVSYVKVSNEEGEYEVSQVSDTEWECEELEGLPLIDNTYTSLTASVATVVAYKEVENPVSDLNEYGLADPPVTVYTEYRDGDTLTLYFGNLAADSAGFYCKDSENDNIYLVDNTTIASLFNGKLYYINTQLLPSQPISASEDEDESTGTGSGDEGDTIQKIEINRPDDSIVIVKNNETDTPAKTTAEYVLTSPVQGDFRSESEGTYISSAYSLYADEAVAMRPTEDERKEYGFDSPLGSFQFTFGEKTYTIVVGDSYTVEDGYSEEGRTAYYIMLEGVDVVYSISADNFPWQEAGAINLYAKNQMYPLINNVREIQVEINGKTYSMELDREDGEDGTTMRGASVNGNTVDLDKFQSYFILLGSAPSEELHTGSSSEGFYARITYTYWDSSYADDVVEFIPQEDRKYILSINGEQSFLCRSAYVSRLESETEKIAQNQTIITQW